jgi:hypothetical protein
MNTVETGIHESNLPSQSPWYKSNRMWFAVPLALAGLLVSLAAYAPGIAVSVMATDSCNDTSQLETVWKVWLVILWPLVMAAGSIIPAVFILRKKKWWISAFSVIVSILVSLGWFSLWLPILNIIGC